MIQKKKSPKVSFSLNGRDKNKYLGWMAWYFKKLPSWSISFLLSASKNADTTEILPV